MTINLQAQSAFQIFTTRAANTYTADAYGVVSNVIIGNDVNDLLKAGCIFLSGSGVGRDKLDATGAPGSTNDSTQDFQVGSMWVDIVGNATYFCTVNTVNAAVWTNGFSSSTTVSAGGDASVGHVDVYPATTASGKVRINCANNAGAFVVTITNASFGQSSTITIPDPGASSASFVLNAGASTIGGVKTFSSNPLLLATNAITAFAGGGQGSAVALTATTNRITVCATIGDSVKLMTATAGLAGIVVRNDGAAGLAVFPATGDAINALAANTSVLIPPGKESIFNCAVTGTWSEKSPAVIPASFVTGTTTTTFAAGQLTGSANVFYTNTQATPGSIATRTATQMFADDPTARVGGTYVLTVVNGQGTGTLTITAGSGVTLTGTATVAPNTTRTFVVTYTSATALVMQNVSVGTFS